MKRVLLILIMTVMIIAFALAGCRDYDNEKALESIRQSEKAAKEAKANEERAREGFEQSEKNLEQAYEHLEQAADEIRQPAINFAKEFFPIYNLYKTDYQMYVINGWGTEDEAEESKNIANAIAETYNNIMEKSMPYFDDDNPFPDNFPQRLEILE